VHAHEERYPAIARRMGVDPDSELPVDFDPTDPAFLQAYLDELHHPREAEGVDFWWLDWQHGGVTRIPGLDPLWLLNHFHYLDSGRPRSDGRAKRPLTFSRYAGVGSHRYPIGFSGDTVITWASLDFQPYFTATASNVGYGWWSHDIGGHFFGYKDDELAVRWTQFGVFAPITRLHSSDSPFNSREPWRFGDRARRIMTRFLALRHRLVPYLYTMNRRAHADGEPLVQPMYYEHPDVPDAYRVRNQYRFGDRLLVAPITTPADRATGLGAARVWLPPGMWTDVFTGLTYRGGTTILLHRDLDTIPVLAPAGAILPLAGGVEWGTANPGALELRVYAGVDGGFTLAEDQDDGRWAFTRFTLCDDELRIHPVEGDRGSAPVTRSYDVVLCGFADVAAVQVDGAEQPTGPGPVPGSVSVQVPAVTAVEGAVLRLLGDTAPAGNRDVPERLFALLDAAQIELTTKERVYRAVTNSLTTTHEPARAVPALTALDLPQPLFTAVVELLLADQ
jgi:hypothetical protein